MLKNNTQPPQRLTDISHYFLSDANERLPIWQHTAIIPVLLSSWNDDHVVYELDRAFGHQHCSCMVLNIENHLTASAPLASPRREMPSEQNADAEPSLPRLALIPLTSTSTTLALQSDRIVIAVDSSLSGVRLAYDQLAFLASLETDFTVSVIMINANQACDAERFYRFIFDSSESLLGLTVECAGFLLNTGGEQASEQNPVATDINGIAREILEKLTPASASQRGGEKAFAIAPTSPVSRLLS